MCRVVRRAIEAVGAQLWFLPKYSPALNPIELAFAAEGDLAQGPLSHTGGPVGHHWRRRARL